MKLELATFSVKDVKFGKRMSYNNGVLGIDKEELVALILKDSKIALADLGVAFPGEQTRIVKVRDAMEPRVKVSGPGCVFPGIMCPVETVGEGRTHRLSGVAVLPSADYRPTILSGTAAQSTGIVDMWGPGAQMTPFGSIINIVPILKLVDGVTEVAAQAAIRSAECRVAHRLAETTKGMTPENVEVFELVGVDPSLPRVVYILTVVTELHMPHSATACYGLPILESLPTFIHPNELLDGAMTTDTRRGRGHYTNTWAYMYPPVVLDLFRRHGKQLNFLGVILQRTRFENQFGKQVTAAVTSQMARLLGADGVILTRDMTSGNNFLDLMLTVQACEQKGIKTVFLTPEWGGKDGNDMPLIFYVPEATATVSTGSFEREITLPAPAKVIGAQEGEVIRSHGIGGLVSPWGELTLPSSDSFTGGIDWFGHLNFTCVEC